MHIYIRIAHLSIRVNPRVNPFYLDLSKFMYTWRHMHMYKHTRVNPG